MIYFITARDVNRVKIGCAKDPQVRLKQLQTGCPAKCVIEAVIEGGQAFEREIHGIYFQHRAHGEWFELTPALEMAIRIANGQTPREAHDGFFLDWLAQRRAARKVPA